MDEYESQCSPVKIKCAKLNDKYGPIDIVIDRKTQVTPMKKQLDFNFKPSQNHLEISPLSTINQVIPGQLVSVKCKVVRLSSVEVTNLSDGDKTDRQEAILLDHTSSAKFIMWGKYVNNLQLQKSYIITNARVRKDAQADYYISTAKSGETKIEMTQDLEGNLAQLDMAPMLTIREILAKIIRISNIHQLLSCSFCGKAARLTNNPRFAKCEIATCANTQLASTCSNNWFFKIAVQSEENTNERVRLAVFHNCLKKIPTLCNSNMKTLTESDLIESVLSIGKCKVTFDSITKKLIKIERL